MAFLHLDLVYILCLSFIQMFFLVCLLCLKLILQCFTELLICILKLFDMYGLMYDQLYTYTVYNFIYIFCLVIIACFPIAMCML